MLLADLTFFVTYMEFCELWHKRFCSCSKFELPAKFSIGHALLLTSIFLIYTNLFLPMLFYFPKSLLSCFPPVLCGVQLRAISADNNMFQILKNTKGLRLSKSYYSTVCTSSSHESIRHVALVTSLPLIVYNVQCTLYNPFNQQNTKL